MGNERPRNAVAHETVIDKRNVIKDEISALSLKIGTREDIIANINSIIVVPKPNAIEDNNSPKKNQSMPKE